VSGVILAGGRSSRMGEDKALVAVEGRPMIVAVAEALRAAGLDPVVVVGGDREALGALGLVVHDDDLPGAGPAAATSTALGSVSGDVVVVAACDLPRLDDTTIVELVAALTASDEAQAAVPAVGGRPQFHLAAYRRAVRPEIEARVREGVRSMHALLDGLAVVEVVPSQTDTLRDADAPGDL
jgi:molybdopterin-guanine dinucleotide biosynthesis protein A